MPQNLLDVHPADQGIKLGSRRTQIIRNEFRFI